MPYRKWTVEPVYLARNPLPPDKVQSDFEFEHVVNGALVKCIQQLSSILRLADKIFEEIGSECRLVHERAERITSRIESCHDLVVNLNARAVAVPLSDLNTTKKYMRQNAPYKTVYEQSSQLFLPSNRPQCIDSLYNKACASPVSVICTIDRFRTDGCTSSQLFMVTPVLGGDRRRKKKMLDIETRKPAKFSLATYSEDSDCNVDGGVVPPSIGLNGKSIERLPSPEELTLAASLEYPSTVVPVDITGSSFKRMILSRRSLIHTDFEIKRKKGKHKSKRRHTVCEGNNKDLEEAVKKITMINNSCQTEEPQESASSLFSFRRSFSRRRKASDAARRETVALDGLNIDLTRKDSDLTISSQDQNKKEAQTVQSKKSSKGSLMSRAAKINPISSLSAAISMAVKMRHSKSSGKQDDGRSSSGNWSASSSARASLDSDQHHAVMLAVERNSNLSRNSAGKDSVLSDATTVTANLAQHESTRNQELPSGQASNDRYRIANNNKRKAPKTNPLWDYDHSRDSNASTPERTSDCASTPLVMSPYTNRRNRFASASAFDDGDSSVYSVDTDGYYTSMHTDSGLWNTLNNVKNGENQTDSIRGRHRQESQSSVSTIGNGSINSFLSKIITETENSSTCSSLKQMKPAPDPPPRKCSFPEDESPTSEIKQDEVFEKENSPPKNGSESDYESRDRLRVKTTINSSRYPSLCAVSPETSDDEIGGEDKSKTLTTYVIAEVHREDTKEDKTKESNTEKDAPLYNQIPKSSHAINMYGGNSPDEETFNSRLLSDGQAATSTPKQKSLTSFTSDSNDAVKPEESQSLVQKLLSDLKNIPNPSKDLIGSNQPPAPKATPCDTETNLIPLKYAQRITVTPIVRHESMDNSRASTPTSRSKSFLKNSLSTLSFRNSESVSSKPKSPSYVSFHSPDSPVSSSTSLTPDVGAHDTSMMKKAVARVTLDPMGKVIYSSSSLERNKREDVNCNLQATNQTDSKYSTFPKSYAPPRNVTQDFQNSMPRAAPQDNRFTKLGSTRKPENVANKSNNDGFNQGAQINAPASPSQSLLFRPSRGGRLCRTYFPSHIISTPPITPNYYQPVANTSQPPNARYSPIKGAQPQQPVIFPTRFNTYSQSSPAGSRNENSCRPLPAYQRTTNQSRIDYYGGGASTPNANSAINSELNTNIRRTAHTMPSDYGFRPVTPSIDATSTTNSSISPVLKQESFRRSPLIKTNVASPPASGSASSPLLRAYSYQKLESNNKISEFPLTNPPDVIPSSSTPPSTLDITARTVRKEGGFLSPGSKQSPDPSSLKSLSSTELFAIIHNSKKKHNIKTDSEKSLSPMSSRSSSPSVSGLSPAKTMKIETGVLGRSGKDRTCTPSPTSESTGAAIDRLGRNKPTSMRDFKMLLLQTRGGTESSPRRSAAELLKVSPNRDQGISSSNTLPRTQPPSSPVPKYPQASPYSNHSTIPLKRGTRTRSPFLTRYDSTYPPIWEDCSEDLEAADENQNTVNTYGRSPSQESYLSRKTVLDNEKCNSRSTTTWV